MSATHPPVLSPEDLDPTIRSGWLLQALTRPLRFFVTVTLTFSVLGGLLQVLGSTRWPLARSVTTAVTVHIAGNLVSSLTAITFVVLAQRLLHKTARISVIAAVLGGATGGAARLPLELAVGSEILARDTIASMGTEAAWFAIAATVTNVITRLARNERDTRDALRAALDRQTMMRTQMLNADMQLRRDVAEWLHGHLQAELLMAVDDAKNLGPDGVPLAARLTRLRDDELRSFAHSLHPTTAELNLVGALQDLAKRFSQSAAVTLTADTQTIREPLDANRAVAAYRSCEEAVANAVKHGGARTVAINLTQDDTTGALHVTVTDDGSGAPGVLEPGLGLMLVDTYLRGVNGTWDLTFAAGAGATFSLQIPRETV